MTARFIPPVPNCGHVAGVTFTHDVDRKLWLCPLCLVSVGSIAGIVPSCLACGGPLPKSVVLSISSARTCSTCARDALAHRRSQLQRSRTA